MSLPKLRGRRIAIDIETTGLDPFHGDRAFCWAYHTDKGERGFMEKTPATLAWLRRVLYDRRNTVAFHNAKFDLKMLSFDGIDHKRIFHDGAHIDCTLILSKLANMNGANMRHDLLALVKHYLGADTNDKTEIEDWLKNNRRAFAKEHGRKPNFSDVPRDILERRNLWDVEHTLSLHAMLREHVDAKCSDLYETERTLLFAVIDMELHGQQVDITRARELRDEALTAADDIISLLRELIGDIVVTKKVKGTPTLVDVTADEFKPTSNQHLVGAFQKLGIPLRYRTKPKKKGKDGGQAGGGNWSFDEYAMIRYVSKPLAGIIRDSGEEGWGARRFLNAVQDVIAEHDLHERELLPPLILKYRELTKMVSTYYDHIINDAVDTWESPSGREYGILHCLFNQSEALTGRFSSSKPNLQNMPRILGPRECFVPRRGRRNWHLDYEQVEMKFFVHFAKDQSMADAIAADIHLHVAARIYGLDRDDVTKEQRKRAKAINFGIIYGAGAKTIAETLTRRGLPTTTMEATTLVQRYHHEFPSIKRTTALLERGLRTDGYVTNPFGRMYHIPPRFGYKALNYMCQGTSADQMKRALVDMWLWLESRPDLRTRIVGTIHDEIVFETPPCEQNEVLNHARTVMEDVESYFVPITIDAECVVRRWSQKRSASSMAFAFDS